MSEERLKVSPPWITYIHKLTALFDEDPQIAFNVDFSADRGPSVTLSINNGEKAAALIKLLPTEVEYGNITLTVTVDCNHISNRAFVSKKELFETAFEGNPIFAYAVAPADEGYWYPTITYVVFKNCVVQFFNDNLNDCHGLVSTLYQDIATDIFLDEVSEGVFFNTDVEKKLGKPLGEWP